MLVDKAEDKLFAKISMMLITDQRGEIAYRPSLRKRRPNS